MKTLTPLISSNSKSRRNHALPNPKSTIVTTNFIVRRQGRSNGSVCLSNDAWFSVDAKHILIYPYLSDNTFQEIFNLFHAGIVSNKVHILPKKEKWPTSYQFVVSGRSVKGQRLYSNDVRVNLAEIYVVPCIEWIAENVTERWSCYEKSYGGIGFWPKMTYCFESSADAVAFKLRFG